MLSLSFMALSGNPKIVPYFSDYNMHFPPQIWEENGGASYSPNVAYLAHAGRGGWAVEWGSSPPPP